MKTKQINDAIGLLDDALIEAYDTRRDDQQRKKLDKTKRFQRIWKASLTAACVFVIAAGGVLGAIRLGFIPFGASSGNMGTNQEKSGYMFYTGPVLPLSIKESDDRLTAKRELTFDFLPYLDRESDSFSNSNDQVNMIYSRSSFITDHYAVKNHSDETVTATGLYPVTSSMRDLTRLQPSLLINGEPVIPELVVGPYSGGFTTAWGAKPNAEMVNLEPITSWEQYQSLLSDSVYIDQTFTEPATLDVPVIVYEFSDTVIRAGDGPNPSLGVHYRTHDRTTVLSYGFHGLSTDGDGQYIQGFSLPNQWQTDTHRYCLIVIGDDITTLRTQGYENMGMDQDKTMEIDVSINRYETTLDILVKELLAEFYALYPMPDEDEVMEDLLRHQQRTGSTQPDAYRLNAGDISPDMLYQTTVDMLLSYGLLSDNSAARYETGWLMDIFGEVSQVDRVIYLKFDMLIPAGEKITVEASMLKQGHHDFYVDHKEDENIQGYDMVTTLGSELTFAEQTASIVNYQEIEIIQQNFGFDLAGGLDQVQLDTVQEHYYLEVRKSH